MDALSLKRSGWILPLVFLGLIALRLLLNDATIIQTVFFICYGIIGLYLFLFKKELFTSLAVFFIPLSMNGPLPGGATASAPSEIMVALMSFFVILSLIHKPVFSKRILFHPLVLLLALDLLWMMVCATQSEMHMYSAKRVFARMVYLIFFLVLISQWMVEKKNLVKFLLLYALGCIYPIISTFRVHSKYNFDPRTVFEISKPFFSDHTIYGAALAFVIPFILILAVKARDFGFSKLTGRSLWILFIVFTVAEFMSFSRAAWLSLAGCFLMFVFLKLKLRFIHFLIIMASLVSLFIVFEDRLYQKAMENENISNKGELTEHIMSVSNVNSDASNLERINRWRCAIRMYHDRPLTGFGPGTYQFVYAPYQSIYEMTHISTMEGNRGNAHSEPLTYLCETGLPGLISYLIWTFATFAFGIRAYHRATDKVVKHMTLAAILGFTTFFLHGLVNSFLDQIKIAGLVFGSMAMIIVADLASASNKQYNAQEKDS